MAGLQQLSAAAYLSHSAAYISGSDNALKLSVSRLELICSIWAVDMEEYLRTSEVINWQHPEIIELGEQIASVHKTSIALAEPVETRIAKACFEWVRDEIRHSFDYQMNPITWRASDVLKYRTHLAS